jgi:hypothetical protein
MPRKVRKARPGRTRKFDAKKEVRAIARERVGPVKAGKVIQPKRERKPKYKSDPQAEEV